MVCKSVWVTMPKPYCYTFTYLESPQSYHRIDWKIHLNNNVEHANRLIGMNNISCWARGYSVHVSFECIRGKRGIIWIFFSLHPILIEYKHSISASWWVYQIVSLLSCNVICGAHMNVLFIIKVKIFMLIIGPPIMLCSEPRTVGIFWACSPIFSLCACICS